MSYSLCSEWKLAIDSHFCELQLLHGALVSIPGWSAYIRAGILEILQNRVGMAHYIFLHYSILTTSLLLNNSLPLVSKRKLL